MEPEWRIYSKRADFNAISRKFNISPVLARILRNRDIIEDADIERFLYGTLDKTYDPELLMNCRAGAELLIEKIRAGKKVRIISDYDVDGVASNYILYDALERLGVDISYDVPDRIKDGYGMNIRMIEDAHRDGVDTILTCDNGIAAFDAIDLAKEYGMTVIVTDHHQVQEKIPDADIVIDPWQPLDEYPFKSICGAEVAYKFIKEVLRLIVEQKKPGYERASTLQWEMEEGKYLDFVALAVVCDVMPLIDENRIYVIYGMKYLEKTDNLGMKTLLSCLGLEGKTLNSYTLGFQIGPTINAAGRLESAETAIALFLTKDLMQANKTAEHMNNLNQTRKRMTELGVEDAIGLIREEDPLIVVYVPGLHESLAGIVAGRLREQYYKPAICFTDSVSDENVLKGSARSIEAYNIFEKLNEQKDLLLKYGGHPLAAGLSIRRDNLVALRSALCNAAELSEDDLTQKIFTEMQMPVQYVTVKLVEEIAGLEPYGQGNERPIFADAGFRVIGYREMGTEGKVVKLTVKNAMDQRFTFTSFDGVVLREKIKSWFGEEELEKMMDGKNSCVKIDVIYYPGINEFRGERSLELYIKHIRKSTR